MLDKITDWLIKRRLEADRIPVAPGSNTPRDEFKRVLNTLRENNVMVATREDGIYIRMAGDASKSESFSYEWAKVKSF